MLNMKNFRVSTEQLHTARFVRITKKDDERRWNSFYDGPITFYIDTNTIQTTILFAPVRNSPEDVRRMPQKKEHAMHTFCLPRTSYCSFL